MIVATAPAEGAWEDVRGAQALYIDEGNLAFAVAAVGEISADRPLDDNTWHHVAVTVEADLEGSADTVRLYIDGSPLEDGVRSDWDIHAQEAFDVSVRIGFAGPGFLSPTEAYFSGAVDDVAFWHRALSAQEVYFELENPGVHCEPCHNCIVFRRGDANADGDRNIADAVYVLGYLFGDQEAPSCPDAADANDDGALNIADAVSILGHLFGGQGPLPDPFDACGTDLTPDPLEECVFPPCF